MESTQQLQPLDSLDTFLIMLDYDCETPALQLPDLDELHDSSQDNPSTTTSSSEVEPNSSLSVAVRFLRKPSHDVVMWYRVIRWCGEVNWYTIIEVR